MRRNTSMQFWGNFDSDVPTMLYILLNDKYFRFVGQAIFRG
jgi:hypothetical protein